MKVGTRILTALRVAGVLTWLVAPATLAALPQVIPPVILSIKAPTDAPFSLPELTDAAQPVQWTALAGPATVIGTQVTLTGGLGAVTLLGTAAATATHDAAPDRYVTFLVSDGGGFVKTAAGEAHSAALKEDGTLWLWGRNDRGQLGDGTTTSRSTPARIVTPITMHWTAVACGSAHTIALRSDGTLWAWGANDIGQLGLGNIVDSTFPAQIGTETTWAGVACGTQHTAARQTDGSLWTWGSNSQGQLGDGTIAERTSPVRIGTALDWVELACGAAHTLGRRAGGSLWAWGSNTSGQLGDGTTATRRLAPVRVGTGSAWRGISAGYFFSAARQADGSLWSWGSNFSGQLGDGTRTSRRSPAQMGTAATWSAVQCGGSCVLATHTDGSLWGCGDNSTSQLGDGTTEQHLVLTQTIAGPWFSLALGSAHVLAVRGGVLWTWGTNDDGQLALSPEETGFALVPPSGRAPSRSPQTINPMPTVSGRSQPLRGLCSSGLPAILRVISGPAILAPDSMSVLLAEDGVVEIEARHPGDAAWESAPTKAFRITADGTPPVFTAFPSERMTVQLSSPLGTAVEYTATAEDATDGPTVVQFSPPSGSLLAGGSHTVSATATDVAGNTVSRTFIVAVNRPPTFSLSRQQAIAGVPLVINAATLLAAIHDLDHPVVSILASAAFTADHGTVDWDGVTLTYTSADTFAGLATLSFDLADGDGATITASFTVESMAVSSLPEDYAKMDVSPDGSIHVVFRAGANTTQRLMVSYDLATWIELESISTPPNGLIAKSILLPSNDPSRVYLTLRPSLP